MLRILELKLLDHFVVILLIVLLYFVQSLVIEIYYVMQRKLQSGPTKEKVGKLWGFFTGVLYGDSLLTKQMLAAAILSIALSLLLNSLQTFR